MGGALGPTLLLALAFDARQLAPYFADGPLRAPAERFAARDWAGAAAGFSVALEHGPGGEEALRARYLLALARENLGRWKEAAPVFEALFEADPLLRPYHAAHAARCLLRAGDAKGALAWAARVPSDAVPAAEARLVSIEALASQRRWGELEAEARRYVEGHPNGPRWPEAMFTLGQAEEALGRKGEAARAYLGVWAESPLERWGDLAQSKMRELHVETSAGAWVSRGMILFAANQNQACETAFAAALRAPGLDPALTCRARYHLAAAVWKERKRARALPLFAAAESSCRAAADEDLTVKALYHRGRCLSSTGDRAGAMTCFAALEKQFPAHSYADDAHLRAAEAAHDAGEDDTAAALLESLPRLYPTGDNVGEALWRLALHAYERRSFAEVHRWLGENLRLVPHATVWYAQGRAEYWQARAFAEEGNATAAADWLERAARRYPLSYYAWLAFERLRGADPPRYARLVAELRPPLPANGPVVFAPSSLYAEPAFQRAVTLARLGQAQDAQGELARIAEPVDGFREDRWWITALVIDAARLWSVSQAIARTKVTDYRAEYPDQANAWKWRLAYPRAFPALVAAQSRATGVPEAFALADMREESAFDPRAESTANCLGLTMMKPSTAQKLLGRAVTREALLDPATSIELGARQLASLLARYRGSPLLALAAYDAGEGAVDRWLAEHGNLPADELLELVPFDETRNYTKRVLGSYFVYAWLEDAGRRPLPAFDFRAWSR